MMDRIALAFKKSTGFTLIELLAVIAILGILIAVAAPNLFGTIDRAEAESIRADARSVKNAVMTHITLDRVDRGDTLPDDNIEALVGDSGTLNEYIDMSSDRAILLDEELSDYAEWAEWNSLIEALDEVIANDSESGSET